MVSAMHSQFHDALIAIKGLTGGNLHTIVTEADLFYEFVQGGT